MPLCSELSQESESQQKTSVFLFYVRTAGNQKKLGRKGGTMGISGYCLVKELPGLAEEEAFFDAPKE